MPRRREEPKEELWQIPIWSRKYLHGSIIRSLDNQYTELQLRQLSYSLLWLVGAMYFQSQIYVIFSGIFFIFVSLGARRDEDAGSAYSVFNRGARHLLGDLRGDQIDREHRGVAHLNGGENLAGFGGEMDDAREGPRSKDVNKPCPCGSGKKLKKCCGKM